MPRVKPISRKNVSQAHLNHNFDDDFGDAEFDYDFDQDSDYPYDEDSKYTFSNFHDDWNYDPDTKNNSRKKHKARRKGAKDLEPLDFY